MKIKLFLIFTILLSTSLLAQTKVKGIVLDTNKEPIPYCNIQFKGSAEGTTSNDNGSFYLESDKTWQEISISFIGYKTLDYRLTSNIQFNLVLTLEEEQESLNEITIVTGKQPKENNPAIDILRKIWAQKRKNGLKHFNQYQYKKYQKVEFDLNTIDDKLKDKRIFKNLEFIFDDVDTSNITGKSYLPVFLNESLSNVYGDNTLNKEKDILIANQNSGFSNNQELIAYIDDLYADYNIYDNYIKIFDKSFVSPLSKTGISNYNYYLADSAFIDKKWSYNLVYYPRRKNELTFKGDFWVSDTTFAIKKINLQVVKNANINWVKDVYIEQEYDLLNDSIFVLKKDYFLSDFSLSKKEKSRGVYGKKTTIYKDYVFNKPIKDKEFYDKKVYNIGSDSLYNKPRSFWDENRFEDLNKNEQGIYQLIDTLKTVKKFQTINKVGQSIYSRYFLIEYLNFDYGPIFSTFGYNDVEGLRIRAGGRTFKTSNDLFRVEGYGAYGLRDQKFKYGVQAKWLLNKKNRFTISLGKRDDVEQIGTSLTATSNVLGQSDGSSSLVGTGTNDKLTKLNLTNFTLGLEPIPNIEFKLSANYKTLSSASSTFSLDYNDSDASTGISSQTNQFETIFSAGFYPGRKMSGYGVHREFANPYFTKFYTQITKGSKNLFNSDFDYTKVQFSFFRLWKIGGFGRLTTSLETGKTYGAVPLSLLSVAPGNQTYFMYENTFNLLDFYEFVSDTYASFHLEHNFNGRIFSRIPLLKKANLRTIIGLKTFWGSLSDQNIALNTTGNNFEIPLIAPDSEPYYEYSVGVSNIFKILRVDFNFRGNYLEKPDARNFGITAGLRFKF
ncbi:DUF5686 and carboxypeptidase regulatory-like domain-containing protein [Polaribacter vadi]|uniref:DUF5686 family protein n=1 Tax=Polaribacter TaxID=52959 RepID=UPI001C088441|nr:MULTISPECIES: DUF5686 family protein [Polaribacter]MBU3010575.1 DUF5686 and carboxypeptidase regulatory-like domain-containing protein [Polaribacter vadi]MDO6740386.1 DUF5686 family protein [Polaribacter sp. 1_MG-2023]